MPSKVATISKPAPRGAKPERKPVKIEEPAPSGPTVKANITSTALAPSGKSFLDALRTGNKPAAPAVAAAAKPTESVPAAVEKPVVPQPEPEVDDTPVKEVQPAPEVPAPGRVPVKSPAAEPVERSPTPPQSKVEAPLVVSRAPAVVPEHLTHSHVHFSWTNDDDLNFQFQQPRPQYVVQYPASVLENRARNVIFKAPNENQSVASAVEALAKERQSFELEKRAAEERFKSRDLDLNKKEAELVARERQLRVESEKLQQQIAQKAQTTPEPPIPSPPQQMAPLSQPQSQHPYMGMPQQVPPNVYQPPEWTPQDRWTPEMAPSYEMYNGFAPQRQAYNQNFRGMNRNGMGNMGGGGGGRPHRMQPAYNHPQHGGRPPMDGGMAFTGRPQPPQQYMGNPGQGYKTW